MDYLSAFQREFQPQLSKTISAPNWKAADYSAGFEKRDKWLRRGESEFLASFDRNAKVAVQNAKIMNQSDLGSDLKALGQFSKSLAGAFENIQAGNKRREEEKAEQDRIDGDWAAMMGMDLSDPYTDSAVMDVEAATIEQDEEGNTLAVDAEGRVVNAQTALNAPGVTPQEVQESQLGTEVLNTAAGITERFRENGGTPVEASELHESMIVGTNGDRVLESRMTVNSAKGMYPAFLSQFIASDKQINVPGMGRTTVSQAMASGDPAVMAMVIQYAPRVFIEENGLSGLNKAELVQKLSPTVFATNGNMLTSLTNKAIQDRQGGNVALYEGQAYNGARSSAAPGQTWRSAADALFQSNTGLSRRQANEKALDATLKGLISKGDVDGIMSLGDTLQVPGQAGTELNSVYGEKIHKALEEARTQQGKEDTASYKAVREEMFQRLGGVSDPVERARIVDEAARELESVGQWENANKLRNNITQMRTNGQAAVNAVILQEEIAAGADISTEYLDEQLALGLITQEDHKALTKSVAGKDFKKDPTFKATLNSQAAFAAGTFLQQAGLKKDEFGNVTKIGESSMDPASAKLITDQMKQDLKEAMSVWASTYGQGMQAGEFQDQLSKFARAWIKDNVNTAGGKYDITFLAKPFDQLDTEQREAARARLHALAQPEALAAQPQSFTTGAYFIPQDLSPAWDQSGTVPNNLVQRFSAKRGDKLFSGHYIRQVQEEWASGKVPESLKAAAKSLGMTELSLLNQQLSAYGMPIISRDIELSAPESPVLEQSAAQIQNSLLQTGMSDRASRRLSTRLKGDFSMLNTMAASIRQNDKRTWNVLTNPHSTNRQIDRAINNYRVSSTGGEVQGGALQGLSQKDYADLAYAITSEAALGTDDVYAVAASILNRVADPAWPNTVAEVIYQSGQYEGVYKGMSRQDPQLAAELASPEGQNKIVQMLRQLQGRTDFKGQTQMQNRGEGDYMAHPRGNFFHYAGQRGRGAYTGPIPTHYQRFIR
jgi:hypothetical protein